MGIRLGKGIGAVVALLAALVAVPAASAGLFQGTSEQPGHREVTIYVKKGGPVQRASIEWIANCHHHDGAIRGKTVVTDFSRARNDVFAERFRGHVGSGRDRLFVRYLFVGKRKRVDEPFAGTFRLGAKYDSKNPPKTGQCRTNLVRWVARPTRGDE